MIIAKPVITQFEDHVLLLEPGLLADISHFAAGKVSLLQVRNILRNRIQIESKELVSRPEIAQLQEKAES
jgi:hypothetical protein